MSLKVSVANRIASVVKYTLRCGGAKLHRHVVQTMFSCLPQVPQETDYVMNDLKIEMITPSYVKPDISDRPTVERIFTAFQKAKKDQIYKDKVFMPSSFWQKHLDSNYCRYTETNIDQFHSFLSNFGSIEHTGINWSWLVHRYTKTRQSRKYFEEMVIRPKISWWLKFESKGRDISALSQPRHGNLWGANVNNNFVTFESVLNEFYGRMISNFVRTDRPVVGEIGAGYGILLYIKSLFGFLLFGF